MNAVNKSDEKSYRKGVKHSAKPANRKNPIVIGCLPAKPREEEPDDIDYPDRDDLTMQGYRLWNFVIRGRLYQWMLIDAEGASEYCDLSLVDLYGMIYGIRNPNKKELLHLCKDFMAIPM